MRSRAGRDADAGRPHAAAARPHHPRAGRTAARGSRRLCGRARRPGARALQHQCADRISARDAELVSRRPSACQRRSGGAAVRRDRRADRRGRRRYRDRGRHRRCRAAGDLSVSQRPLRAGGGARPSARRAAPRSTSPRCWITISSGSIARARCSAFSPTRRPHRPAAQAARAAALIRRGVPAGRAQCRRRHRAGDDRALGRADDGDQGGAISPIRGRCATSRSACATTRRCRPTRGSWWSICGRRGGRLRDLFFLRLGP